MSGLDRLPVIVGVAQVSQRTTDPAEVDEPAGLMTTALRMAAKDSEARELLGSLDLLVAVAGAWRYPDPARLVAERVGAAGARTALTTEGGNNPQGAINRIGAAIAAGQLDIAAVTGAEAIWSRRRIRAAGGREPFTSQLSVEPDEHWGNPIRQLTETEAAVGLGPPKTYYALVEGALRSASGASMSEHRQELGRLWQRFNARAVSNPHAWSRESMSTEQIVRPSERNRMVCFPYTKVMCANWDVDQGAAVVICSGAVARAAGIPRDRWVFLLAGGDADDPLPLSERWSLAESPALGEAGRSAMRLAGVSPASLDHVDLYSCFPSAVQVAARELGFSLERDLTVTGGLTFAGGPYNNYVTHSVAGMVEALRAAPGTLGLVTANGGYLSKHAVGIYSTEPRSSYLWHQVESGDVAGARRAAVPHHRGKVTVEAATVVTEHDRPDRLIAACLTEGGGRCWATSTDLDHVRTAVTDGLEGVIAHREEGGEIRV